MRDAEEQRYREIFHRVHAGHTRCLDDEWLSRPCHDAAGRLLDRPVVWSRRNGPWTRVPAIFVGAAPGNAGGKGRSKMGAHGTRIPFGGDIAGGNLDVLLAAAGMDRDHVFITAALNQLPGRGGGEPTVRELMEPVGDFPTSLHVLRDTMVAAGAALVVALGNVALRAVLAAAGSHGEVARMPGLARIRAAGLTRGRAMRLPAELAPDADFTDRWHAAWDAPPDLQLLPLTHPSAQTMSPYAGEDTAFHRRMREARDALVDAVRTVLGRRPPPEPRPWPETGIYALRVWQERVGPRHAELAELWRRRGIR